MANLVALNIKRKDAEVASHGFSMFLDPKRIKLQDDAEIPEMMEEEEPLAEDADAGAVAPVVVQVQPTMLMPSPSPSPVQPTQGQEADVLVHDSTVSTESGSRSSEPRLAVEQAAPMAMDIEEDSWQSQPQPQPQPGQHRQFWSGFF